MQKFCQSWFKHKYISNIDILIPLKALKVISKILDSEKRRQSTQNHSESLRLTPATLLSEPSLRKWQKTSEQDELGDRLLYDVSCSENNACCLSVVLIRSSSSTVRFTQNITNTIVGTDADLPPM